MSSDGADKVKKSQLDKAIRALSQLIAKRTANANPLFGSSAETMVCLFTLSHIPDKRKMKPVMIPLPHPMFDNTSEVCFFSKDPQKQYKELLLGKVPGLTKIIGLDKLRRNYKTPEQKRALADSFDLFLCDRKVVEMMPKLLGTVFYSKKLKLPVPVRMKMTDPAPLIQKAISSTPLRVPTGPCLGVKFGRCSMEPEKLVENCARVISTVMKYVGESNPIQTVSVQATDAPALPVWRRARTPGELLDLKKYHSDAASSAASDTGKSASDTEGSTAGSSRMPSTPGSAMPSTPGSPLPSTPRSAMSSTVDDQDSLSELDLEAGDVDDVADGKDMPLLRGLKRKKNRKQGKGSPKVAPKESPKTSPKASPKAAPAATMAAPMKKQKKK